MQTIIIKKNPESKIARAYRKIAVKYCLIQQLKVFIYNEINTNKIMKYGVD